VVDHDPAARAHDRREDLGGGDAPEEVDALPTRRRPHLALQRVVVEPACHDDVTEVGRQEGGGRHDLPQALDRGEATGVGERVLRLAIADLRVIAGGGEVGEVLHHGGAFAGEAVADGGRRGHDAVERRGGEALQQPGARGQHPLGPPRDPELVHDLLRRVLVDVVHDAAPQEPEQQSDPQQFRVVQVVELRPLLERRAEDLPHDPGRAIDPIAWFSDTDDRHARDRFARRVPDDERDVVACIGEALALPVEDPVVAEGMNRRQVPDPRPPARVLVRHWSSLPFTHAR
jgi:hypothetical protein